MEGRVGRRPGPRARRAARHLVPPMIAACPCGLRVCGVLKSRTRDADDKQWGTTLDRHRHHTEHAHGARGQQHGGRPAHRGSRGRRCRARRRPARDGDLLLLFASVRYDLHALHAAAVEHAAPARVVGASTAGAFAGAASIERGCVAALLPGEGLSFGICPCRWDPPTRSAQRAPRRTSPAPARARTATTPRCCCSPMACRAHGREFARGVYDVTSALVPVVGGAAADDMEGRATWTFADGVARTHGIAAVWIDSDLPIGVAAGHGFRPVGCPHVVTKVAGRGRARARRAPRAGDLPRRAGRAPPPHSVAMQPHHVPSHPLGAITVSGHHDLFPVAPSGTGLAARTEVPEGTLVEVMCTDVQGLVGGARRAGLDAVAQLVAPPRLALAFSGVDRVPLLGGCSDGADRRAARGPGRRAARRLPRLRRVRPPDRPRRLPHDLGLGAGAVSDELDILRRQNDELRERVDNAERNTARTLLRATRLAQVISALGQDMELDVIVERAAIESASSSAPTSRCSASAPTRRWPSPATTACSAARPAGAHVRPARALHQGPRPHRSRRRRPRPAVPVPLRRQARRVGEARRRGRVARPPDPRAPCGASLRAHRRRRAARHRLPDRARDRERPTAPPDVRPARPPAPPARHHDRAGGHDRARHDRPPGRGGPRQRGPGPGLHAVDRAARRVRHAELRGRRGPRRRVAGHRPPGRGHLGRPGRHRRRARRGHRGARDAGPPPRHRRARAGEGAALRAQPGAGAARLAHRAARAPGVPGASRGPHRRRRAVLPRAHRHRRLQAGQRPATDTSSATRPCAASPRRCASTRASSDDLFRIGGEEFCAVLHDVGAEEGLEIAERLRTCVAGIAEGLPSR